MEPNHNQATQNPSLSPTIEASPLPVKTEEGKVQPGLEFKKHPMFIHHQQDEILSFLIQMIEAAEFPMTGLESVKYTDGLFKNHLFYHMFGRYGETAESLHESKVFEKPKKAVCAKKIMGVNVYIKCLDCELASKTAFGLCTDCYDKEKHKDHRVCYAAIPQGSLILCGCGQDEFLPPERFCNKHTIEAFGWEETLATFPPEYLERYKTVVKKAFYGFRCLFEIASKTSHQMTKIVLLKFAGQIFCEIIVFCEECQSTISQGFLSVFMDIMKDSFLEPYNRFWKDCDANPGTIDMEHSFACKCSILGRILQVILFLRKEYQSKFGMIIFACVKNEKFREFFVLEYTKYFEHLYIREYKYDTHPQDWMSNFVSSLADLETHFFWNREDLLIKILKAGNFEKILLPLKRLFSAQRAVTTSVDYTITRAMHTIGAFIYPKMKTTANLLITEFAIIRTFLNFLRACEINFGCKEHLYLLMSYEEVQFDAINRVMQCELQIRPALDLLAFHLANAGEEMVIYQRKFVRDWYEFLKKTKADLASEGSIPRIFAPGLERAILSILWSHMKDEVDLVKLEVVLREGLPPEIKIEEVAENVVEAILKFFGMVRFLTVQYNFDKGPIYALYYNPMHNLFEIDVMIIQLMTAWIQPEKLFKILAEKFFGNNWRIADLILNFSSEKHYGSREPALMRDFLEFLLFLMKDEVVYFNLRIRYADMATDGQFDPTARDQFVTQQIIRDALACTFSAQYFGIKNFFAQMFRKSPQLDAALRETTILDDGGQNIRLKPELQTEYDSSAFYKFPSIQKLHDDAVLVKFSKKGNTFDILSGRFGPSAPEYLKVIQRNMFQSSLVDFLGRFIQDFSEKLDALLQSILRLILLNLYVLEDAMKSGWNGTEILKSKVKENYLDEESFMENLNRISKESKYEDCCLCIGKIKSLINGIFLSEDSRDIRIEEGPQEGIQVDKKQLALNKMNKLKEEIAKKQALFVEKNLDEIQKSPEKISHHVCQFCLEEVDNEREDFGLPIYISFTNNLCQIQSPEAHSKQDYSDLSKLTWWPVISSCGHHYHKKCFVKLNENTNNLFTSGHFLSQVESTCLLCKSLCNSFLCLNESKNSGFIGNLYQDMSLILSEFKSRMLNIPNASVSEITERELFRRTFEYFTETFHVYEKPELLKSTFNLYTSVLSSLKNSLTTEEMIGQQTEGISLLDEVFGKPETKEVIWSLSEWSSSSKVFTKIFLMISGQEELQAKYQMVLAEYLTLKVIQLILFEKLEEALVTFTDCINYFMTHKAFQTKVIKETTHFIQKIILTYQLNECALTNKQPDSKLSELLCSLKSDEQYLSELLRFIGINSSFEEAVSELLRKCEKKPLTEILLTSLSTEMRPILPSQKLAPRLVKLPQTYAEFVDKYFDVKCSLCNKISPLLNGCLCLICGDLICGGSCDFVHGGNLNQHAKDYHMGIGYFLDRSTLQKLLINMPVNCNLNGKRAYIDEFGQIVTLALQNPQETYKVDYKKYLLNPASEQEDKEIINYYSLPRTCFREATASQINHPPGSF